MSAVLLDQSAAERPGCSGAPGTLATRVRRLRDRTVRLLDGDHGRAAVSVFDQAIVSGTAFVTGVLISRAAGPTALGVYYLAVSLLLFFRGFQEQLVYGPYMVLSARRSGRNLARYEGSVLAHEGVALLAVVAGVLGLIGYLALGFEPAGLWETAWVLTLAAPPILFREYARHVAFAHYRVLSAVLLDAAVAVCQLVPLAALWWLDALTAPRAVAVMGVAAAVGCAPWLVRALKRVRVRARAVGPHWRRNWKFGRWALATHLLHGGTHYVMPWVVSLVRGEAATGVFAAGSTLVGAANMFVLGLANYLSPKAAGAYAADGLPGLRRVLRYTALVFTATLGPFALLCLPFGDAVASLVFGDGFGQAGLVLAVLAFNMWANALSITCGNGLWAVERPDANLRADVVSLAVTAAATAALIPPFGVVGAAGAMLAGGWSDVVARYLTLRRVLDGLEADTP